ncbi:hypothetical protein D3C86_1084690 [compost metagenome]
MPVAGKPSTFELDGGPTRVTAVDGDLSTSVLVFKSTDLGGTASAPSVLTFYENNDGGSELNDASTVHAGYGVGAASGSVLPGNVTNVSVQVSQPPAFKTTMLNSSRHADAGSEIVFSASDVQPGDCAVVVRASNPSLTSDFIDLTKVASYDFYPLTDKGNGSYAFTPTRTTGGMVNYYLSRGEMVSKIGADNGSVSLAKLHVHPGVASKDMTTVRTGSDDGTTGLAMARRANETDTLYISLRDAYGNAIKGADMGTRALEGFVWRSAVEPSTSKLAPAWRTANATHPAVSFIPGSTIGRVSTPTDGDNDGVWTATFTQGSVTPTAAGTAATFTLANNSWIQAVSYLYDPSNLAATNNYALGVITDPANPASLWLSLYRGTSVAAGTVVASRSYSPDVAAPDSAATASLTPTAPLTLQVPVLRYGRGLGAEITTADHDTRITVAPGARAIGDVDVVQFRLVQQNPDGSLNVGSVRNIAGGSYSWKQ